MMQSSTSRLSLMPQLRTGLLLALPLLLIVNGLVWSAYLMLIEQQREMWRIQAETGLDAALITIEEIRNDLHGDLFMLAGSPLFKRVLDGAGPGNLDRLAGEWEAFAAIKQRYDQIRWLDSQGRERLRVNLTGEGAERVSDSHLQDKSQRYYFKEAAALRPGQIYASQVDLNIEHGEVERPYKPMLRLAVPALDSRGERQGLLVVNALASRFFDELARHAGLNPSHLLMISPRGYYLWGFDHSKEWGFMFPLQDDTPYRFDKAYPSVWQQVVKQGLGRVDTPQGLFLFRTIRYGTEGFSHRYFMLAAVLPGDLAEYENAQRLLWLSVSLGVSLVLLLLSLFLAHYLACCRQGERADVEELPDYWPPR